MPRISVKVMPISVVVIDSDQARVGTPIAASYINARFHLVGSPGHDVLSFALVSGFLWFKRRSSPLLVGDRLHKGR